MNCIIVDDEPLGREAIQLLMEDTPLLKLSGSFGDAQSAGMFLLSHPVDLVFMDIQMPGINGIEFARNIPRTTLVIFTTAFPQYALDSYEVDAIGYLVKPIEPAKFQKTVEKAIAYHSLLLEEEKKVSENGSEDEYIIVKSDRRYFKVNLKDILFVEGLKDYVIIQLDGQRIITRMSLKNMQDLLPKSIFLRINRSYIVNREQIDSFDNNDVFIKSHEVAIGISYREAFFKELMEKETGIKK
jgi:DNA-binding LytR/AlgR family response regulator